MTTALYRRYRPESFGEMIGQSQVTEPLMTALRRTATDLRHRLTRPDWDAVQARGRLWTDQARSYLALLLTAVPRSRPVRTVTVFIATVGTVTDGRDGPAPGRAAAPAPDATP